MFRLGVILKVNVEMIAWVAVRALKTKRPGVRNVWVTVYAQSRVEM